MKYSIYEAIFIGEKTRHFSPKDRRLIEVERYGNECGRILNVREKGKVRAQMYFYSETEFEACWQVVETITEEKYE